MKNIKGHQGDVQFKELAELPTNLKKINNTPLAYGEISGHVHVITGDVEMFEDDDGNKFAVIGNDGANLQHVYEKNLSEKALSTTESLPVADHKEILLKQGVYEFGIQKKYNPFSKVFERVVD